MPDITQLGASGSVVFVVLIFLKYIKEDSAKRDAREERFIAAIGNVAKESKATRTVAKSADQYLRDRNGRDAKSHKELMVAVEAIPTAMQKIADTQASAIITAVKVDKQSVKQQTVQHQTVKNQE